MLLQKLKQQTREHHERIDHALNILNTSMTIEDYKLTLRRFWGFYFPVETRLDGINQQQALTFDFERRKKTALLINDLKALGIPGAVSRTLPTCTDLPELRNLAQALGCMYVLEGATLGGQIISRHVKKLFGFDEKHGCAFFSSYGRDVGHMWRSFGDMLVAYSSTKDVEEAIIYSACETFIKLNRWLLGDR